MKKEYQKPEVEYISLMSKEEVAASGTTLIDDVIGGETGVEISIW